MEEAKQRSIITDKLVVEKTGKSMEHWFKLLDKRVQRRWSMSRYSSW